MAAPITHTVFAHKAIEKLAIKDWRKFLVGTNFPDIRHMSPNISREVTHFEECTWESVIKSHDAFGAGMRFHNLVDTARFDFMKRSDFDRCFLSSEYIHEAEKLFEDRILYKKIADWTEVQRCFDGVLEEELMFGVDRVTVQKWHSYLQNYFGEAPVLESHIQRFVSDVVEADQLSVQTNMILSNIIDEDRAVGVVERFYSEFWQIIDVLQ